MKHWFHFYCPWIKQIWYHIISKPKKKILLFSIDYPLSMASCCQTAHFQHQSNLYSIQISVKITCEINGNKQTKYISKKSTKVTYILTGWFARFMFKNEEELRHLNDYEDERSLLSTTWNDEKNPKMRLRTKEYIRKLYQNPFETSFIHRGVMDRLARYNASRSFAHIIFKWYAKCVYIFQPIHIVAKWMNEASRIFLRKIENICVFIFVRKKKLAYFFVCISTFV